MDLIDFKSPVLIGCFVEDIWALWHLPTAAGVYLLTDTKLNLKYVGSSVNVRKRVISHLHPTSPTYKKFSFLEIDPKNIKAELIEDCQGMEIADMRKREAFWIRKLNTNFPNGLNVNSPSKGYDLLTVKPYMNALRDAGKITPCYQLLKFSFRIGFYADMVRCTPINPLWFNNGKLFPGVRKDREKLENLKFADLTRPYNSYH